jgi:hypothetical protein
LHGYCGTLHNIVLPSNFLALETSFCPYPPTAKKSCRHFTLKRARVKRMPKDQKNAPDGAAAVKIQTL